MIFGGFAFWEVTRLGGWSPHEWDSSFYKRGQRALCAMWGCSKKDSHPWTGRSFTGTPNLLSPWLWTFQSPELWEISVCCSSHSVYGIVESMVFNSAAAAKSLQLCPTLCGPMDCSLPGSSIYGIFRATVLEWGAIAFSHGYCTIILIIGNYYD